ncbi:unnamed protein product [Rhizoctonia solani]|uniref:Uncharacterized protein n=1 Tax=Rhizoctonia solani TaxID=456999 RepID=A0A8H3CYL0_9AGAM|nr:unnamed protein product [Rhizoctonia solani]
MLPAINDPTKTAMAHNEDTAPSIGYYSSGTATPVDGRQTKPAPPSAAGMQTISAVEEAILATAKIRASRPVDQTFFLAVMAGIWVGFGGIAGLSAASGMPISVRAEWPIVPKFLTGAFFAFALHFIVIMGGELVTGTTLIFSIGWYNRAIPTRRSIINLVVVYIGNWCGCLVMAYFMAYLSDLFGDASSKQWMNSLVLGKVGHGWGVLFLRAIGANTMVCIAIAMFNACTDAAGKIMILWIPVVTFVISGFEHCVANTGSSDLELGPHLFPQTKIFFVQYRYGQPPAPAATSTPVPPPTPVPPAVSTPAPQRPPPITVSHELHAKVLAAASKDADLNLILQLASQGRADVTQLRTLGAAIKAIEAGTYLGPTASAVSTSHPSSTPAVTVARVGQSQTSPTAQPAAAAPPQPVLTTVTPVPSTLAPARVVPTPIVAPPKPTSWPTPTPTPTTAATPRPTPSAHVSTPRKRAPPAIPTTAVLLEFAERPIDRWLLPTEYVLLDRRSNGDIHLSTFYPFDAYVPAGGAMRSKPAHPLTMRFVGASSEIWDALSKTCTTVAPGDVQAILAEVITNVPQRAYLQYRIAPGALWEDIKTANPHAQSFILPSKTPIPSTTTTRQRRMDSATGGSVPKKRKTDLGDNTTSKPKTKAKEKEKEKETETTTSTAPTPAPTNQPAAVPTHQPVVASNVQPAPVRQIQAPIIPNAAESTSKAAAVPPPNPTPTPTAPVTKLTPPTTSTPPIDTLNMTTARIPPGKAAGYSARVVRTSHPDGPTAIQNNPAGPLYPPQHPALSQVSPTSQPQTSPPSQQAERLPNQNASMDPPVTGGKS